MYTTDEYRDKLILDNIQTLQDKKALIMTAIGQNERNIDHNRVWCNKCKETIRLIDQLIKTKNNSQFKFF